MECTTEDNDNLRIIRLISQNTELNVKKINEILKFISM